MVNGWERRYLTGESLSKIAGGTVDDVTVWYHLRKRGVKLRDIEAQITAVTKHQRIPFSGNAEEKAYLIGLAQGDSYVTTHGRLVRAKTASTHPGMYALFKSCFQTPAISTEVSVSS